MHSRQKLIIFLTVSKKKTIYTIVGVNEKENVICRYLSPQIFVRILFIVDIRYGHNGTDIQFIN